MKSLLTDQILTAKGNNTIEMKNDSALETPDAGWIVHIMTLQWNTFLEIAILSLMVFVGLAGNIKVIRTFLKVTSPFARQIMALYFALALSDGLICSVRIPLIIYGLLLPPWENSNGVCTLWQITAAFFGIIILKNLLVAFQRLVIMYSFPAYRKYVSLRSIVAVVISIWVLQGGFICIATFLFNIKLAYQTDVVCISTNTTTIHRKEVQYITEGFLGIIPIALTVVCHIKIVWNICRAGLIKLDKIDERSSYVRINVTAIMRSMVLLVCCVPYLTVNMLEPSVTSLPSNIPRYLDYLLCVQSVISPFITLMDSDFSVSPNRRRSYIRTCVNKGNPGSFRRSLKRYLSNITSGELRTNRPTE